MMFFDGPFHGGPYGVFWGLLGFLINLLVLGLIVWLIVALLRGSERRRDASPPRALTVLEERYAKGEVSRDEFLERRSVLIGNR